MEQSAILPRFSVDPETGFIENDGNFPRVFDPKLKAQFLQVYKSECLGIRRACRKLGMSVSTVNHHLQIDPAFREAFELAEKEYMEDLECVSRENALNPKSVIERIFQLKCLLPSKYGQENKPQAAQTVIHIEGDLVMGERKRVEILEAEITKGLQDYPQPAPSTVERA